MAAIIFLLLGLFSVGVMPSVGAAIISQVTIRALDANGVQLANETVFVINGTTPYGAVSSVGGAVSLNLVQGSYTVRVLLFGVEVGSKAFNVTGAALELSVPCRVYSLTVAFKEPVPRNANWTATAFVNGVQLSQNVSVSGQAVFQQIPTGLVRVLVTNVTGQPVASGAANLLKNGLMQLSVVSFMKLRVLVSDVNGSPVPNATVSVGPFSNVTAQDGSATLYVQQVSSLLQVTLLGVPVSSKQVSLPQTTSGPLRVNATVGVLNAPLVDEGGQPISDRQISLSVGNVTLPVETDHRGYLSPPPQIPFGNFTLRVAADTVPFNFTFPIPQGTSTLKVFAHPLTVTASAFNAYMLGYLTVEVVVKVGDVTIRNATVSVNGVAAVPTTTGSAVINVPVGLNSNPTANVLVKAYGITIKKTVSAKASPLLLVLVPFNLTPLIAWRIMVARYKKRRVPLAH